MEQAVLVSVIERDDDEHEAEASLDELERLLNTAEGEVFARMTQNKEKPDARTYIGSGKVKELADIVKNNDIPLVIFDTELSPSQIKNLEDDIGGEVRVIDRTMLILDIFAKHAVTNEGKVQVELAQLRYTAPRLTGKGLQLSRQQGGREVATRGPGETKLETDRRHLQRRVHALEKELDEIEKNRVVQRSHRNNSGIKKIAIAGYTNAGKSTLLNYLTNAGILAEDKLFATLDPTTRRFTLSNGTDVLLTDTVGFIRNLPHHLVKAFKSTLEEVTFADIIIVMIDASDPERDAQLDVTKKLLNELGAGDKTIIYVYNKCDVTGELGTYGSTVYISAQNGEGVDKLVNILEQIVMDGKSDETFKIPNNEAGVLNRLYKEAVVTNVDYGDEYITVKATVDAKIKGAYKSWII
ncbi:MAG: GTPase HflX [Oscillospiraceae bacterium]|nr:GTPase HflX [Oscillospiraceae bacterium]